MRTQLIKYGELLVESGWSAVVIGFAMLATGFVFVCGANDGAALLALALRQRELPLYGVLAVLLAAIIAGPALFGLAVAHTFTDRLVDAGGVRGPWSCSPGSASRWPSS
ncbi:hypothetical protein ACFQZ4_36240 [Catellatospora coxensis]